MDTVVTDEFTSHMMMRAHECGHCVTALSLCGDVTWLSVSKDGNGVCHWSRPGDNIWEINSDYLPDLGDLPRLEGETPEERQRRTVTHSKALLVLLAGPVAEYGVTDQPALSAVLCHNSMSCDADTDIRDALHHLGLIASPERWDAARQIAALMRFRHKAAEVLVRHQHIIFLALYWRLAEQGALSGAEVDEVVEAAEEAREAAIDDCPRNAVGHIGIENLIGNPEDLETLKELFINVG